MTSSNNVLIFNVDTDPTNRTTKCTVRYNQNLFYPVYCKLWCREIRTATVVRFYTIYYEWLGKPVSTGLNTLMLQQLSVTVIDFAFTGSCRIKTALSSLTAPSLVNAVFNVCLFICLRGIVSLESYAVRITFRRERNSTGKYEARSKK